MTGAIVTAVAAAVIIGALFAALRRATRLERLLEAHDRDEADLEAIADATREPPPLGDEHAERLLRIVRDREAGL